MTSVRHDVPTSWIGWSTNARRHARPGRHARARVGHHGGAGDVMVAKRAAAGRTGKRRARRTGAESPASTTTQRPDGERRLVDIDPWAVLLEQLMEVPEEGVPAGRKGGKRE